MTRLPPALAHLAAYRQFFLYRVTHVAGEPKPRKVPVHPLTLQAADAHAPSSWVDADTACALATAHGAPHLLGFSFQPGNDLFFIDIDGALQADGQWSSLAVDLCARFAGAAVEVSQSGRGLHIIGRGTAPPHACKNIALGIELYTAHRGIALTGAQACGDANTDHTVALGAVVALYFPPRAGDGMPEGDWTTEPRADWHGPASDEDLLRRARQSTSIAASFGANRATFDDLWTRNEVVLTAVYPDPVRSFDASSADAALAAHLAFWTGCNCERMLSLMKQSALARDKWEREDYLQRTILGAVARQKDVLGNRDRAREESRRIGETVEFDTAPLILTLQEMREQLVYVEQSREVAHRPTGRVRTWEAATGAYAGSKHTVTDESGKQHQTAALPLWRSDAGRKTVDVVTWAPGSAEFCAPPESTAGNGRAINTWRGFRPHALGDVSGAGLFVEHIAYLIPDDGQRVRFVQWLAHIIAAPEALPHTCYLMVAKSTGIGRNWLASVLARVLRGYVALGVSLGPILDGKFNGRLSQKLLAVVDETRDGLSEHRYARGEAFKRLITEEHRLIDAKYGRQEVQFNVCRWLLLSNHDDAIPFENNDRRVIVIENPTVCRDPAYYGRLYAALSDPAFIGSVWHYLCAVDLSGFDAGAHAPMSDAKARALQVMTSGVDGAVEEFRDTWPGRVAGRRDVRQFVENETGESLRDSALKHAMLRAGLVPTSTRVGSGSERDRVVGLRATAADIAATAPTQLSKEITDARRIFRELGPTTAV